MTPGQGQATRHTHHDDCSACSQGHAAESSFRWARRLCCGSAGRSCANSGYRWSIAVAVTSAAPSVATTAAHVHRRRDVGPDRREACRGLTVIYRRTNSLRMTIAGLTRKNWPSRLLAIVSFVQLPAEGICQARTAAHVHAQFARKKPIDAEQTGAALVDTTPRASTTVYSSRTNPCSFLLHSTPRPSPETRSTPVLKGLMSPLPTALRCSKKRRVSNRSAAKPLPLARR